MISNTSKLKIFGIINEIFHNRFFLLVFFGLIFVSLNWFFVGNLFPDPDVLNLWFYSGIFMVLFSLLFIEPYYTSPKNVITNAVPLLLVFLSIKSSFENKFPWWLAMTILLSLLIASIVAIALEDKNKSPEHNKNKIAEWLKNFVVLFGQGKILYSAVFLYFLFTYYSTQNTYTLILLIIWFFILAIDPKKIKSTFIINTKELSENAIGEIFGVQSKKIFLVKLFDDRKGILKFDIVKFRYSMQDSNDFLMSGIVFDTYLLNQEKWAKILQLGKIAKNSSGSEKNVVYKVSDKEEISTLEKELRTDNFVGIVIEGSNIGKIKFEYSKKQDDLQEGDLVELRTNGRRLFYQVVNGVTEKESLEHRNETGFIKGEAIQLGEWINDELSFQKYGWVPSINIPIFKADTSDIEVKSFKYPDYKLGIIPNTSLPSVINLADAVSHHMALLGVTGSGKSFLAREIINQLKQDTKVICIDFTGEWEKELNKYDIKNTLLGGANINNFLENDEGKVGIVGLSAMSNTSEVIQQTEKLFETIFNFAKEKYNQNTPVKISLVLEEAHTITPETSFLGDLGDYGSNKALVNKMSQVALQGRKYGVGMMIIAQRTANVSKTVLTQCNTVICFQAFDETSFNFLGNYVGKDLVSTLPNLKQYHAIVTGKAIKSNVPMIIDLKR
ncbi:MAG: DUF87 domain-containing protein [Parcubacteria group bacterium]|jgi:hypothetical protein